MTLMQERKRKMIDGTLEEIEETNIRKRQSYGSRMNKMILTQAQMVQQPNQEGVVRVHRILSCDQNFDKSERTKKWKSLVLPKT